MRSGCESYSDIKGRVMFYQLRDYVIVRAEVSGLPKCDKPCESPIFAFHIHSGEECTGDKTDSFKNAGTHYNPNNCKHSGKINLVERLDARKSLFNVYDR